MKKTRYFLIAYNHEKGFGNVSMTTSGYYPNNNTCQVQLKEGLGYSTNQPIVVINIVELNEQDFNEWIEIPTEA